MHLQHFAKADEKGIFQLKKTTSFMLTEKLSLPSTTKTDQSEINSSSDLDTALSTQKYAYNAPPTNPPDLTVFFRLHLNVNSWRNTYEILPRKC